VPGYVLLIPFILLGVFLSARLLGAISAVVIVFNVWIFLSSMALNAAPGAYSDFAALVVIALSATSLSVMWVSAGGTWLVRKIASRKTRKLAIQ